MNCEGTVAERQRSDIHVGLPWQQSLCLQTSIDCASSCTSRYMYACTRIDLVHLFVCGVHTLYMYIHTHAVVGGTGGRQKRTPRCYPPIPPPPLFFWEYSVHVVRVGHKKRRYMYNSAAVRYMYCTCTCVYIHVQVEIVIMLWPCVWPVPLLPGSSDTAATSAVSGRHGIYSVPPAMYHVHAQ